MADLKNMSLEELEEFFASIGEKKYRGKQVFQWIYRGVSEFDEMTDISKSLRKKMMETAELQSLKILRIQESQTDETRKYLLGLGDGNTIESVFMKYKYGNSICVSSQAGCRMGCKFCASAIGGLKRNLTAGELADQILRIQCDAGRKISHVVVMGTGEPLDNYENLKKFIYLINSKAGLNIGMRNITVSTCGLIPIIEKFAKELPQVNLAISLHAPNDDIREKMMPVNRKYPINELLSTCRKYTSETGRRVTFEYALVSGVNDMNSSAEELAGRLRGMLCHVNLIPLNSVEEAGMKGSTAEKAQKFMSVLERRGIAVTVRRTLGGDIAAACGQLRLGENQIKK